MTEKNNESLWKEIRKTLVASLVTASITLFGFGIVTYFTVASNTLRIDALENESVRKDVLASTLEPMKESIIKIDAKLDTLVNGFVAIGISDTLNK